MSSCAGVILKPIGVHCSKMTKLKITFDANET